MPSSAQASTRATPRSLSPGPMSGEEGAANWTPVANSLARLQTGPSERSPAAYQSSSACSPGSIASAPSRCRTAAGGPPSRAASRSAALRARTTSPARASASRRPATALASAAATACETGSASATS